MLFNLDIFKKRNLFDEAYFLYFEEQDLFQYCKKKKYPVFTSIFDETAIDLGFYFENSSKQTSMVDMEILSITICIQIKNFF